MNLFILVYLGQNTESSIEYDARDEWVVGITFLVPFFLAFGYILYKYILAKNWEQKMFPRSENYSDETFIRAYACLCAHLIEYDKRASYEKIRSIHLHLKEYFPNTKVDINQYLELFKNKPIETKHVGNWLKHRLTKKQAYQLMYFIVGIAYEDGKLITKEYQMMLELKSILDISPKEFNQIFASHKQRAQRREYEKKYQSNSSPQRPPSRSEKQLALEILGVSEFASMEEIKKVYRKLAKTHHPDRFATSSPEQQKIAEERFKEIQKAYEILEKRIS
jgi:DnaJ like chaperone protein